MITDLTVRRQGDLVILTAASDLAGTVVYHWFLDGLWIARTTSPTYSLTLLEQARIDVVDTLDAAADPAALAPTSYPARRRLWWVRSLAGDVDHYRVEQQAGGGDWQTLAEVAHDDELWSYDVLTVRLEDLTAYTWRIVPVDRAGNDGTPLVIGPELIVRRPDAPEYQVTFNSGTGRVTIAA